MTTTTTLIDTITTTAKQVGIPAKEAKKLMTKYQHDLSTLERKLKRQHTTLTNQLNKKHNQNWYNDQAIKANENLTQHKTLSYHQATHQRNTTLTLGQRLDKLLTDATTKLSNGKTSSLQPQISNTKPGSIPPPKTPPNTIERFVTIIQLALTQAEKHLDRELGLTPPKNPVYLEPTEELDKELITEWKGWDSAAIAWVITHLGSQRTIERARIRLGYTPRYGDPKTND